MKAGRRVVSAALLALLASVGLLAGQDAPKADTGRLPKYFDRLNLTDAQRAEVVKLAAEHREKREKVLEELRKPDEEAGPKKLAVLTDAQRRKLVDLMAGPEDKGKEMGRADKK